MRKQKKKGNGVRLNGGRKSGQEIKTKDKGIEGRKKKNDIRRRLKCTNERKEKRNERKKSCWSQFSNVDMVVQ